MKSSLRVSKIKGIDVKIHYSWFIIFILISWSLAEYYFPNLYPGWTTFVYWVAAIISSLSLFVSILLHELSHSLVGLRDKVIVKSITLFIFGGVAEMEEDPKKPLVELKMAAAGPLFSLILSGFFYFLSTLPIGLTGYAITRYLFMINGVLAIFNLVPAFPLDGGRVLRSTLWKIYNDYKKG